MCAAPSSLERNVNALRWTSLCSPCRWRRDFALSTRRQQTLFEVRTKAPCDWGSSRRTRKPIVTPRFCPFFLLQKKHLQLVETRERRRQRWMAGTPPITLIFRFPQDLPIEALAAERESEIPSGSRRQNARTQGLSFSLLFFSPLSFPKGNK